MPGIAGIISNQESDNKLLEKMLQSIKHQESHRVESFQGRLLEIGRVHLGIFNPGPQPFFNKDKSMAIVMDGKIYGYEEDKKRLKQKGYTFTSDNDAEFCLALYQDIENSFVKKLNGSFVLVIYDLEHEKVIIANDRFGFRPVYYTELDNKFIFASEVKAILQDPDYHKELDQESLAEFFAFGEFLGNKTWFKSIHALPNGSIWTYESGALHKEQYWDYKYKVNNTISEKEIVNKLITTFKKAVDIRMDSSHLKYGVSLSGGLDSRVVLGAIDKSKREKIAAINFGVEGCIESKIAHKVAKKAGVSYTFLKLDPDELIAPMQEVIYLCDGMDSIMVGFLPYLNSKVKKDCDVLSVGLALDLSLGGSYLTKDVFALNNDNEIFTKVYGKMQFFSDLELRKLLKEDFYKEIEGMPKRLMHKYLDEIIEELPGNKIDSFFQKNHVRRYTIMGQVLLRNAVEDFLPTYDNDFYDVLLSIPPRFRLNHRIYRKFLNKLSGSLSRIPYQRTSLPANWPYLFWFIGMGVQYVISRLKRLLYKISKKKIFISDKRSYVNFEEYFKINEKWKKVASDTLLNEDALLRRYLNQNYIKSLLKQHSEGLADHSRKIANLITFELFLKTFFSE